MFRGMFGRLFIGRAGVDALSKFLLVIALIIFAITMITRNPWIYIIGLVFLALAYFRSMSRNVYARNNENQKFLSFFRNIKLFCKNFPWKLRAGFTESYRKLRFGSNEYQEKRRQKKLYKFFNCPSCSQKVRVPKGKGKIEITCPKCKGTFIRKS